MKEFLKIEKIDKDLNKTREWLLKRVKWTRDMWGEEVKPENVFCADLVPWHSKKESDIITYIVDNYECVFKNVLQPLMKMAIEINEEKPKIIVRGVAFFNLINSWVESEKEKFGDLKSYIPIHSDSSEFTELFFKWFDTVKGTFRRIAFLGGEPLISPRFYEYLDRVIAAYKNEFPNDLEIYIEYGDYIGYYETETRVRYYTVQNDGRVFTDNKHTYGGYKQFFRTIIATPVTNNEFEGI
jgi:hypothetical protein